MANEELEGFVGEDSFEDFDVCGECGGEGFIIVDCFEDTCCCAEPDLEHDIIVCPTCKNGGKP